MIKKLVLLAIMVIFGCQVHPAAAPGRGSANSAVQEKRCKVCRKSQAQLAEGEKLSSCKGCRALYYCSRACQKADWKDHKHTCPQLHKDGCDVSKAFFDAVKGDRVGIVRLAIKKGAAVDGVDEDGFTPLSIAVQHKQVNMVSYLLRAGANVDQVVHADRVTPLFLAVYVENEDIVNILIEARADVDLADSKGFTPLLIAAHKGNNNIVGKLIDASAGVNKCDERGVTPLHIAAQEGHIDVVRMLVDNFANINQPTQDGCTVVQLAATQARKLGEEGKDNSKYMDIIVYLLEKGALPGGTSQ